MTFISVVAKKKMWVQHGGTRKWLWVMMVMVVMMMEEEKEKEEGKREKRVMMMTMRITAGTVTEGFLLPDTDLSNAHI